MFSEKNKGHALVELVLCLELSFLILFGTALLRHLFRARSAALTLVEAGSDLAADPDLSYDERTFWLNQAARRLFPCEVCRIDVETKRFSDQPSARFYNLLETRATVHLGHERLRSILRWPASWHESAVVAQEPTHAPL